MKLRAAFVAVLAVALISASCGDDDTSDARYSDAIRTAYIDGCTDTQSEAFCECVVSEFEERYTEEEFIRFAIEASDTPPDDLVEISLVCIGEADLGS